MSLRAYVAVLRARWRAVVLVTLVFLTVVGTSSSLATPTYRATSSVSLSFQVGERSRELSRASSYVRAQVRTYGLVARLPLVLEPVCEELRLASTARQLALDVEVRVARNTGVLQVVVERADPVEAAAIANAVARQLVAVVEVLAPPTADGAASAIARTLSAAAPATRPVGPLLGRDLVAALLCGAAVGALLAIQGASWQQRRRQRGAVCAVGPLSVG